MTTLEQLANSNTQLVLSASTLRDIIAEDRQATWIEGVEYGKRLRDMLDTADLESPLTIKEAADALGFSENSIINLRDTGKLQELYPEMKRVLFSRSEILRFKRQRDNRITNHITD